MKRSPLAPVVAMFALACPAVFAQRNTAQLTGQVTDATGAVIQNAQISVINEATGVKRDTVSNDPGYYTVPLLPPGSYRILARHEGFRPLTGSGGKPLLSTPRWRKRTETPLPPTRRRGATTMPRMRSRRPCNWIPAICAGGRRSGCCADPTDRKFKNKAAQ